MFDHLFIAEKPSMAKAIAEARAEQLGVQPVRTDDHWAVGPDAVTWFIGHMYELAEPHEYDERWKRWSIDSLPIVIDPDKWRLNAVAKTKGHMMSVQRLIKKARRIVNAGDAAREGQLLVDEAVIEAGRDPFAADSLRMWVQSYTRKDMMAALAGLFPNADKRPLYNAAICRQRADWLHGMNFSRLYTKLAEANGTNVTLSVGRVQTPTLRLVVDRDRERLRFKAVDHYLPKIAFRHADGSFTATWVVPNDYEGLDPEGRLVDKAVAQRIVEKVQGKQGRVVEYKSETKFTPPPLPYSLSALQADCAAKLDLTGEEVLRIAQDLYEKHKATTYPRSDSRHLPTSILTEEAPQIMEALRSTPGLDEAAQAADLKLRSAAFDNSKVTDHHGIIPTIEFSADKLRQMSDDERSVFMLIAKTFVAQFHPPLKYKSVSAEVSCEGESFRATGRLVVDPGWRRVYGAKDAAAAAAAEEEAAEEGKGKAEDAGQSIPAMQRGDQVVGEKGEIAARRTSPPPAFTDGTLITAMAEIHKFVSNPEIKKRLKENQGIGREATRTNIIKELLEKKFLKRRGKVGLESTELGRSLIDALPEDLKDPGMTALWEGALDEVGRGNLDPGQFILRHVKSITDRIESAKGTAITIKGVVGPRPIDGHGDACPVCGKGKMLTREIMKGEHKGKKYLSCSNYPDCKHSAWPQPKVEPLEGHGKDCPACGKGKMLTRGVKTKDGRVARLLACTNYPECRHGEWPQVAPIEGHGKACAKCGTGKMLTRQVNKEGPNKGKKFLGCDNAECRNAEWPQPDVPPLPGHGKSCPQCGKGRMLTRQITAKNGKDYVLLACDNYPACKHGEFPEGPKVDPIEGHGKQCPQCGKGQMLTKEITAKTGKKYKLLSCNAYPACKHSEFPDDGKPRGPAANLNVEPLPGHGKGCPSCRKGKMLTKEITGKDGRKHKLLSCDNYPACKNSEWPDRGDGKGDGRGGGQQRAGGRTAR